MSFKVFLSYGAGADEQVAAWRLQTLATSYGVHASVPNRNGAGKAVGEQVRRAIDQSDCVLAIITGNLGPAVAGELNYALSKGKLIVQVVREDITVPPALSGLPLFRLSPLSTGQVEADVVKFLYVQGEDANDRCAGGDRAGPIPARGSLQEAIMRIAIIDISCLICLVHLNLASELALYFDVVYVPRSVRIEFNRKHRSRYRLNKLFEAGLFQRCRCKDETNFQLLTPQSSTLVRPKPWSRLRNEELSSSSSMNERLGRSV